MTPHSDAVTDFRAKISSLFAVSALGYAAHLDLSGPNHRVRTDGGKSLDGESGEKSTLQSQAKKRASEQKTWSLSSLFPRVTLP